MVQAFALLLAVGLVHQASGLLLGPNDGDVAPTDGATVIQNCSQTPFEVVFVLDSSGSVGAQNFTVMKNFVKSVVQQLNIGVNSTHVGVITFNRYPVVRLHLTDFMTTAEIQTAIDQIPYISGITETDAALELMAHDGFTGARPGVARVGIVITDGYSFHPNLTAMSAWSAQKQGITMFSVGIGAEVNLEELSAIATDPDVQHLFRVDSFNALQNIVRQLSLRTCSVKYIYTAPPVTSTLQPVLIPNYINETENATAACNETLADILFILDSSGSLGPDNFELVKKFVINIINELDIGANLTKVGVITFSNFPIKRIQLGQYSNKLDLINAVNVIPYYPGGTQTDAALDLANYEGFQGGRPHAPNIAVVITDGHSTNQAATKTAAERFKQSGVSVFAVGIGAEIDTDELNTISSDPNTEYVFFVANFSELSSIEKNVARSTCEVQQTFTTPPPCIAKVADIMFVIDSSGSVGTKNFETVKQFMKQIIDVFDISSQYTRVGVITYNIAATVQFALDVYNTSDLVKNAVDHILFSSGGTNTGLALETLRTTGFLNERPGVPNIAIIITDGLSSDPIATKVQARLLKEGGDTLIAIGVGNETNSEELKSIASVNNKGKSLVYEVGSFEALQELNATVPYVACTATYVSKPPVQVTPTLATQTTKKCGDDLTNCADYGISVCSDYRQWSFVHCADFCGFCGGTTTTVTPPCVNAIPNCNEYGDYICTTVSVIRWTKSNCPLYCGFCTPGNETAGTNPPQIAGHTGAQAKTTQATQGNTAEATVKPEISPSANSTGAQTHSVIATQSSTAAEIGKTEISPSVSLSSSATQSVITTSSNSKETYASPPPPKSTAHAVTPPEKTISEATPSPPTHETRPVTHETEISQPTAKPIVTEGPFTKATPSTSTPQTQPLVVTHIVTEGPVLGSTEVTPSPPSQKTTGAQTQPLVVTHVVTEGPVLGSTEVTTSPPSQKTTRAQTQQSVVTNFVTRGPVTGSTEVTPSTPSQKTTGAQTQSSVVTHGVTAGGPVLGSSEATPSSPSPKTTGTQTQPAVITRGPVTVSTETKIASATPPSVQPSASKSTFKTFVTEAATSVSTGPTAAPPGYTASPHPPMVTPSFPPPAVSISSSSPVPIVTNPAVPSTTSQVTVTQTGSTRVTTTPVSSGPAGTVTTMSPKQACASKAADVVFVIDSSGSVGQANFETIKSFIKQAISVFDIGPESMKVGMITFNYNAILQFGLNKFNTTGEINHAIDAVRFSAGGTNTGAALETLRQSGFNNQRPGVPNIAIVITDGLSSDPLATKQQARIAKESGNILIAIGVGDQTDQSELQNIASVDKNSGKTLVYNVRSFPDLQSVQNEIVSIACGVAAITNPPPVVQTTQQPLGTHTASTCFDTVSNCADYGRGVCYDYKPWSMAHCSRFCGFCHPTGEVATTASPCQDNIDNCQEYGTYICTSVELIGWTKKNCLKYCGLCGSGSAPTEPPTSPAPTEPTKCFNKLNNCLEYGGSSVCTETKYHSWANENCREYCGFCTNPVIKIGITLPNSKKCPDWQLPKECTLVQDEAYCCPLPKCPDGYLLTVKAPLQD